MKPILGATALLLGLFIVGCVEVIINVVVDSKGPNSSDKIPPLPACNLSEAHLQITGYKQEEDFWCWGATAKTVIDFFNEGNGPLEKQCELVDLALGNTPPNTCCGLNSSSPACNVPGLPEEVFDKKGIPYYEPFKNPQDKENLWAFITNRICSKKPVIVAPYLKVDPGISSTDRPIGHSYTAASFNGTNPANRWVGLCDHTEECDSDLDSEEFRNFEEVSLDSLVDFNPNDVAFVYWTGMR